MNQHFKDQMFVAITDELAAHPRGGVDSNRPHVPTKALLGAAAVMAVVAGGYAVASIDGADRVQVTPGEGSTTTTADPDAPYEGGYVFGTPHGRTFIVPDGGQGGVMEGTPPPDPDGMLRLRIADADPRLNPVVVQPTIDHFATHVVEVIGGREIRTPNGMSYPAGTTEASSTGPWMWNEADGSQWMGMGLLSDLRRALPDLTFTDGRQVPGASLVVVPQDLSPIPHERHRVRDERFEIGIIDDTTTSFDLVDPRRGQLELVDVNGRPGIRSTGNSIEWRADADTVISIQQSTIPFGTPSPTPEELLEAARSVRPATVAEMRSLTVWRGALVERVIVKTPADLEVRVPIEGSEGSFTLPSISLTDHDAVAPVVNDRPTMSFSAFTSWATVGGALPLGPDYIGHRITLSLRPASPTGTVDTTGPAMCDITVTVPAEGEPPVTADFSTDC